MRNNRNAICWFAATLFCSPQTQSLIRTFSVEKFGQPLFVPVAGKREEDLGV